MWPNAVKRRLRDRLMDVTLLALSAVIPIGCDNRETILMIEKPTEVRSIERSPSSPESSSAKLEPGKVVKTLKAGDTAKAVGTYHGQDYDAFHVKLADGTEGLILAGDTFKVVSR